MAKKPTTKTKKKQTTMPTPAPELAEPRRLKTQKYRSFHFQKRGIKPNLPKLPSAYVLFKASLKVLKANWRLFLAIVLVYGVLNLILVRGLSDTSGLSDLKNLLNLGTPDAPGRIVNGFTLFTYLLGSSGASGSANANVYQTILIVIISIVLIWTLRQLYANQKITMRDAYYRSLTPLIPFVLVLAVIGLQLLPMVAGGELYSLMINNAIAVYPIEQAVFLLLFIVLGLLSIYMVCSSVFALYIVTLPDVRPMQALKSARQLVLHRRWAVIRKVAFLPVVMLVAAGLIMIPLIVWLTPVAPWAFFVLTTIGIAILHSYMYALYRSLL